MIVDDDDLPVLTHVLRTGPVERPVEAAASDAPVVVEHDASRDAGSTSMIDPLVIGHEAHPDVHDYLAPSVDEVVQADAPEPIGLHATADAPESDAFALSQDVDPHGGDDGARTTIDEPHLSTMHGVEPDHGPRIAEGLPTVPIDAPSAPVELPQVDASDVARQVRDAVLDGLSARIDTELDARIAQAIHVEVETAFARLQVQLRTQLTEALRDVVGRAVDEEIALALASRPPPDATDHRG